MDVIITSVVSTYHWSITEINKMYLDDFDYEGLYYWYKEIERQNNEIKKQKRTAGI